MRDGILKGIRGPRGGYELGRESQRVTANDILRAAGSVEDTDEQPVNSELLNKVVLPALATAEQEFGVALSRINLDDMVGRAESLKSRAAVSA